MAPREDGYSVMDGYLSRSTDAEAKPRGEAVPLLRADQ
jgi:hypothetical protein